LRVLGSGSSLSSPQTFYFSSDSLKGAESKTAVVSVIGKVALFHFFSNSEGGPHFDAAFNTSNVCPEGFVVDSSGSSCEKCTFFNF
jgi:hypothetical protein